MPRWSPLRNGDSYKQLPGRGESACGRAWVEFQFRIRRSAALSELPLYVGGSDHFAKESRWIEFECSGDRDKLKHGHLPLPQF